MPRTNLFARILQKIYLTRENKELETRKVSLIISLEKKQNKTKKVYNIKNTKIKRSFQIIIIIYLALHFNIERERERENASV